MKTWILSLSCLVVFQSCASFAEIKRTDYRSDSGQFLILEVLNDQTFHFEYNASGKTPDLQQAIPTTRYVAKAQNGVDYQAGFQGPSHYEPASDQILTRDLKITVDRATLCFSVESIAKQTTLTQVCPLNLGESWKGLTLDRGPIANLYGLGAQFLPQRFGSSDGDWMGQVRFPGIKDDGKGVVGKFGNEMVKYPPQPGIAGAVGNTEFPILYAMSPESLGYSLFLDQIYKQRWDFSSQANNHAWKVETEGAQIRGFITVAEDLPTLRRAFMDLVGHPLVPPKKAFGLWVSQYGFDSWTEIEDKLRTLREHHFPIDGFVMDLQWFGNVKKNSENTRMGTLEFDTSSEHFPDPAGKIKSFWHDQGVGLITIEESYIGKGLKEFDDLAKRGFLVKATPNSDPLYINENPWWGLGGMIDWSNPAAGAYWAQTKRKNLVDLGIVGHWTDLGEPEMYRHVDIVGGKKVYTIPDNEADTHNVFSLDWHESIFKGYQAMGSVKRPFILSRSGGPGMQKYGAAMWSGDIGSKFEDLATHYNVQMQMSLSGQDYFGADIGGFHREDLDGDLNELYTQWFADACAFDVPVRPHTEDLDKKHNTAPDRIGDMASNLESVRVRYELSPYYYSLAHLAYTNAEPVVPPVFYYYPSDRDRTLGNEKLIGRNLLVALVARSGEKERNVYLPAGDWIDYRTLDEYAGEQNIASYSIYRDGHFELPIFARAGAIIPKMLVDDQTMNILGKRSDGVTHTELVARVFSSTERTQFTVSEDDGTSIAYQQGALAQTEISQVRTQDHAVVEIAPTSGKYSYEDPNTGLTTDSPSTRQFVIELVLPKIANAGSVQVSLNGELLNRFDNERDYDSAPSGYFVQSGHLVVAKSASLSVKQKKVFDFDLNGKGGAQ